jgi:Rps23 Pro-64 3,4-dihydroxylase Tpa1-like proline 4-hydroxylase
MIKELELCDTDPIVKFANEIVSSVPNIKENGWHKKFVCASTNDHYINSFSTNRNNDFVSNDKLFDTIKNVINIMSNNGFIHDPANNNLVKTNVELHYANSNDGDYIYTWSAPHQDNDNGENVNTFICYFDVECKGGELAIYDSDEKTMLLKIDVFTQSNNKKIIIFSGDIIHNPLKIINGHRYAISFQIPI